LEAQQEACDIFDVAQMLAQVAGELLLKQPIQNTEARARDVSANRFLRS
jgi:hypothetical protein